MLLVYGKLAAPRRVVFGLRWGTWKVWAARTFLARSGGNADIEFVRARRLRLLPGNSGKIRFSGSGRGTFRPGRPLQAFQPFQTIQALQKPVMILAQSLAHPLLPAQHKKKHRSQSREQDHNKHQQHGHPLPFHRAFTYTHKRRCSERRAEQHIAFGRNRKEIPMASPSIRPRLLIADQEGRIYDHPDLLMLCRRGEEWSLPRPDELMPLPEESELFLLPGRRAVGLDPETGEIEQQEELAVAAFAAPAHTLSAHPVYVTDEGAPMLPLFAYGAVGFANGRFYICAKRVDQDNRQVFTGISDAAVKRGAHSLMEAYPDNRLMQHLMRNCVLRYACPAARNLSLGRFEAPLPVSRSCNARCIGCISRQDPDSPVCATPQNRLDFTPTADEVVGVMRHHAAQEKEAIFSFGQGCEGEPLTEAPLLIESVRRFRAEGGHGTINLNSNASRPNDIAALADAGLTSLRVSMNSARPEVYTPYYRPSGYSLDDVRASMRAARARGVHVAVNLLYFPGVTDTEAEVEALISLFHDCGVCLVQLRNLNIDPEYYPTLFSGLTAESFGPALGLANFRKRIKRACPWISFGYFNPWLGDKAELPPDLPEVNG